MVWGSEVATHVATAESALASLTLRAAEALGTALLGALGALHLALLAEVSDRRVRSAISFVFIVIMFYGLLIVLHDSMTHRGAAGLTGTGLKKS